MEPIVGILMGSNSDFPIMKEAIDILKEFNIPYEVNIISAHRTPDLAVEYAKNAIDKGIKIIIAGAGGAAHLPGFIAAFTTIPVIGVPILSKSLNGLDSLLSIVQMPKGIPVATVAINGAANAAILAIQILSLNNEIIRNKLIEYKSKIKQEVIEKSQKLKDNINN